MKEHLMTLIESRRFGELARILKEENAVDIALLLDEVDDGVLPYIYRILPKELAAETFVEMEPEPQAALIRAFSDRELREMLDELFLDDTVDIIEEMPAGVVKRILQNSDPATRRSINEILQYPEDSAGTIMTIEYVDLKRDMTVAQAFDRIRRTGYDKETIYDCYVTDSGRRLLGMVTVHTLLLADQDCIIGDIMETNIIHVHTNDDQEDVARQFEKYDFRAIAVLDNEERLVGIVTFDDAMDVITEEATEDMEIMSAITPSEKTYLRSGAMELFKNRFPWLLLLMLSATFTGMIITSFESALASQVILTAFIPMLMGTGGNTGSQSSVTIIRALSLEEVDFSDIFRVIWKEVRVAVLCGVALALACFAKLQLVDRLLLGNPDVTLAVSAVVCATMVLLVLFAKVTGCILPMLAKKLHLDPAVMASPFITTIVDTVSLLIYFGIAKLVLF
ncbi:MAG: magnesium transporter [Ruminococcaceae bacterium]|nr:magnesium transporter [Oscillospiraceae bacterium]